MRLFRKYIRWSLLPILIYSAIILTSNWLNAAYDITIFSGLTTVILYYLLHIIIVPVFYIILGTFIAPTNNKFTCLVIAGILVIYLIGYVVIELPYHAHKLDYGVILAGIICEILSIITIAMVVFRSIKIDNTYKYNKDPDGKTYWQDE